ncbi:hypothetical protein ACX80E_15580 [Arthrobacter sp. TMN-49]
MKCNYLVIIAVALAGVAGVLHPQQTLASWSTPQYVSGSLTAGTVATPTALQCSGGLLTNLTFTWTAPVGGLPRSGYTWTVIPNVLGPSGSGSAPSSATSVTVPSNILSIGTGTFSITATGPGGWSSTPVTGTITVIGALGIPASTSCTVP